jgi:phosphoglycolate phosphatase-like HAD superfamily hydrolase
MKTFVIFDIDGTLVRSNRVDSMCFAASFEKVYGKPFPTIDWMQYPHVTDTTIFSTVIRDLFGREVEWSEIEDFTDHYLEALRQKRRTEPHHFQMILNADGIVNHLLNDDRYVVGLATGGWSRPAKLKLDYVQIDTEQMIRGYADGKYSRESIIREVEQEAANRHSDITRTVYIGDQLWDVRTTRNLQMNFIGVRWRGDKELLQDAGVEQVLQDYRDLDEVERAIQTARPPQ